MPILLSFVALSPLALAVTTDTEISLLRPSTVIFEEASLLSTTSGSLSLVFAAGMSTVKRISSELSPDSPVTGLEGALDNGASFGIALRHLMTLFHSFCTFPLSSLFVVLALSMLLMLITRMPTKSLSMPSPGRPRKTRANFMLYSILSLLCLPSALALLQDSGISPRRPTRVIFEEANLVERATCASPTPNWNGMQVLSDSNVYSTASNQYFLWGYLGCYTGYNYTGGNLPANLIPQGDILAPTAPNITLETCAQYCQTHKGQAYTTVVNSGVVNNIMGVTNQAPPYNTNPPTETQCFCGGSLYGRISGLGTGHAGLVSDAYCNSPCTGNPSEACGGGGSAGTTSYVSLYAFGYQGYADLIGTGQQAKTVICYANGTDMNGCACNWPSYPPPVQTSSLSTSTIGATATTTNTAGVVSTVYSTSVSTFWNNVGPGFVLYGNTTTINYGCGAQAGTTFSAFTSFAAATCFATASSSTVSASSVASTSSTIATFTASSKLVISRHSVLVTYAPQAHHPRVLLRPLKVRMEYLGVNTQIS